MAGRVLAGLFFLLLGDAVLAQTPGQLPLLVGTGGSGTSFSVPIQTLLFFTTLSFACIEPYFFIGFLISTALFGLYQAIFMANAGGAWDNAKKVVEVELKKKGTPLHDASIVGDTVGDPFKDTSSVALNPVIKFTTLFGVLAVGLALKIESTPVRLTIAAVALIISMVFAYRSFYNMRINTGK